MEKNIYLTQEGYNSLIQELDYLRKEKRPQVIEEIAYAAELGDLRENSEYDAVIHTQAIVEGRIQDLERILNNAKLIEHINTSRVGLGNHVKVLVDDTEEEYMIVSSYETDINQNKISDKSLIGSALLNKKVGDSVTVKVHDEVYMMKIINIS